MSTHWLKKYYQELSSDEACIKAIAMANDTKLRKTTGSIRTQYPIERKLWRLFDYEMEIHKSYKVKQSYFPNRLDEWEEEKTRIYNNMRRIILTVNQIINDREAETARMAQEEEQQRQRIKSISNAARANERLIKKVENMEKIASGKVRRSARLNPSSDHYIRRGSFYKNI